MSASAARSKRIGVHLTPFAPGMEREGIDSPRRWREFWNQDPTRVIRALLRKIERAPGEISVTPVENGDVELRVTPPEYLVPYQCTGSDPVIIAIIWEGMTAPQVRRILDELMRSRWTPPELLVADAA